MDRTRILLFSSVILIIAASVFSYVFIDNNFLIRKWNLPLDPPGFLDSRQFAWASEAYDQGYDPLIENPVNPRGHQLNYPRIWHLLFKLGINESHTNIIGTVVVILFFIGIGVFWFSKHFDSLTYLILSILTLSPAVMLGVERSNIELIIFFVLSVALSVNYYSVIASLFVFEFAAVLKIYPVFSFIYLLKENKRKFYILFSLAIGLFILYALYSLDDFLQVYKTTPKLTGSSFGIHVWWMGLKNKRFFNLPLGDNIILLFQTVSYLAALIIIVAAFIHGRKQKTLVIYNNGDYLDAFRVGSSIYIGCFLLMNTHDYRLIFLIFTIPQLIQWLRSSGNSLKSLPCVTMAAMGLSLWSFFIMRFAGRKLTFAAEELSNWVMLYTISSLLIASFPGWIFNRQRKSDGEGCITHKKAMVAKDC